MTKNMAFRVRYMRTDTGCLQIFAFDGKRLLANLTVFPDDRIWLDIPCSNRAPVNIFPENALHRVWYKEVCRACGWESEPFEHEPVGFGGTLNCPACQKAKRNGPHIEGCYGKVEAVELDWETKKPKEAKTTTFEETPNGNFRCVVCGDIFSDKHEASVHARGDHNVRGIITFGRRPKNVG